VSPRVPGAALAAAVALLLPLPFFDRWFSFMDEGHILQFADIVASGGTLYRDATLYPLPGAFYLLALAFEVFGPSILVARVLALVEFAVFTGLVFALLRPLLSRGGAALLVLALLLYRIWAFPHWQMYSYSTTALTLLVGSLWLLVRGLERDSRRSLLGAGLLFGLGVFCKQDYGAAMLLASLGVLAVARRTAPEGAGRAAAPALAAFLLPAAAVGALAGLHFWWEGVLGEAIRLTVLTHLRGIAAYEYTTYPDPWPLFAQDAALRSPSGRTTYAPAAVWTLDWDLLRGSALYTRTALWDTAIKLFYYAPYPLVAAGAVWAWRRRRSLRDPARRGAALRGVALVATAGALVLLATLSRPQDWVHLAVLVWPLAALAVVWADALLRSRPALAIALSLLLLLPATAYTARLAWLLRARHPAPIALERAGIHVRESEAKLLEEVVGYVHRHSGPDEPVAVLPYFPIVSFLADRRAPHRSSYIIWPFPELPDRDQRVIAAMERTQTPLVLYHFTEYASLGPTEVFAPELFDHLVEHFEMERVFVRDAFGYQLVALRRAEEPRGGRPLVGPELAGATVSVVTGRRRQVLEPPERDRHAAVEDWPFRPALALRPLAGGRRTAVSVPVAVPPGARLRTSVALHPRFWAHDPVTRVLFGIEVCEESDCQIVFQRTLHPNLILEHRGWFDVEVPLQAWSGREVRLAFSATTDHPSGERREMAGFGLPRLVAPEGQDP